MGKREEIRKDFKRILGEDYEWFCEWILRERHSFVKRVKEEGILGVEVVEKMDAFMFLLNTWLQDRVSTFEGWGIGNLLEGEKRKQGLRLLKKIEKLFESKL